MRFLQELRRRKVFRTAVIYVAAAWVLLQAAELLLEMLEVPAWGLKLVFVLLVTGFPLAMILSWMHQLTPQGLKREVDAPLLHAPSGNAAPEHKPARAPTVAPEPLALAANDQSIAVLPFTNMSDDRANVHFADGLSEELLNLLSRIPALRVVARTSSFSFKGRAVSAATIARELNVAHLLEGSVRKAGTRIRITAKLVRAADSSQVWSQSFDRDLSDIFAVQDEIAAAVARELEIKLLGGAAPKSRPTDPQAYTHYLQGRHFYEFESASGFEQAIEALGAAIEIDPGFGPAWTVLGAVYWGQANHGLIEYRDGIRNARAASEKALALDANQAEPLSLLGMLDLIENRSVEPAMQRIERALQLEPHNQRVLARAARMAIWRGRVDEAVRYGEQALRWDPLSPNAHAGLSLTYYHAGRLDEAEAMRRKVLALSPSWLTGYLNLGRILLARNQPEAALAVMQQETGPVYRYCGLALAYHAVGNTAESDAALEELKKLGRNDSAYQVAQVYAYRGELDAAFEWLQRAAELHDSGLIDVALDPLLRNLHTDPRWNNFLASRRLVE
jgi:TolB-like protein/Tfp pilus assembly protein PilF